MSLYYNIPVKTTTKVYAVKVYTAECKVFEYLINASSAKEAQGIGFRKTSNYYRECGMPFYPTRITAISQGFKTV